MSLAVTNTSENAVGFGNQRGFGTGGNLMSCHDPYQSMQQPWAAVSGAIGPFGSATPMPQSLSVDAGPLYPYPRPGGLISLGTQAAGLFPLPDPSYSPPPPPPAAPGPVMATFGTGFTDTAVRETVPGAALTTGTVLDVARPRTPPHPPPPPTPPTSAPVPSSVNPNDLSADRSHQARSVIVQIAGDVGRFLANKKEDTKPPETTMLPKSGGISIVEGHSPTKGFTIDYFGLNERFRSGWAGRGPVPGAPPMPFTQPPQRVGWCDEGDEDPTFLCQICGLKWRGYPSGMLRGRNPAVWDDGKTAAVENPTLERAKIEEFYFYLADETITEPCIKGITIHGNPHPAYRPSDKPASGLGLRRGVVEQDCCPPLCNRRLPPHIINCVFDNCYYVNRSHAELRKHLLKKHESYMRGLIARCEGERPLDDCDRAVCHFLMRSFAGLDAAGKRKISDPKRTVLSPDQMSNPAAYEEHCEWITYVTPPQTTPVIEFRTDEAGQAWQLTYTMDPTNARGPKMERVDPVTRLPLPGGKKRRRLR